MNTASPSTDGAPTLKPPAILTFHISLPVLASSAHTVPCQSPKYATPPATVGVPDTPVRPSLDQLWAKRVTLRRVTFSSVGFSRVFARSCPYTGQFLPSGSALSTGTAKAPAVLVAIAARSAI